MKQRCRNVNNKDYKQYGARGIKVCEEWNKLSNFIKWSYENGYKDGLQIDRIDNDGDYCPSNCHFVLPCENTSIGKRNISSRNTSGYIGISYDKINNKWKSTIKIDGINKTLGRYDTINEALSARIGVEILLFGKQLTNKI